MSHLEIAWIFLAWNLTWVSKTFHLSCLTASNPSTSFPQCPLVLILSSISSGTSYFCRPSISSNSLAVFWFGATPTHVETPPQLLDWSDPVSTKCVYSSVKYSYLSVRLLKSCHVWTCYIQLSAPRGLECAVEVCLHAILPNAASEEVLLYLPPAMVDHSSTNSKILESLIQSINLFWKWYRRNKGCGWVNRYACCGRPWLLMMLLILVWYELWHK